MTHPHYHVSTGLPGYLPNSVHTAESLTQLADVISDELARDASAEYDAAQAHAESGDYEAAWTTLKRSEELETLSRNFSNERRSAPLYEGRDDLWNETIRRMVDETFPLNISEHESMSVYLCVEDHDEEEDDQ